MGRAVYCEHCDYELVGLIGEEGDSAICPECGNRAQGRWLPRRVRVALAVMVAISPMLLGIGLMMVADSLRTVQGMGWSIFELGTLAIGLSGVLLPPGAAWWLWTKSARRRVDFIDIACLVPVGWILNSFSIFAGVANFL